MSKQLQLAQIADDIIKDNICPQLAADANQLVFGEGNPDAAAVFIGEAPGKHEDEQGRPFVGAAGKFLDVMLESIALSRGDVYITNIVKYRPPGNRDPSPEEKAAFWPYLLRQLEVINPELIVTLGRHSMEYFLPSKKIGQIHGQSKLMELPRSQYPVSIGQDRKTKPKEVTILPLYHPAAALYNGGQRQILLDDFAQIATILKNPVSKS